ncbi:MAG: ABC transporter permease [Bacteroidetes bacterium]|nr:ABC transporter permease [Bacteroidota bacterium]
MIEYVIKIKKRARTIFNDRWVWKMAWRDGRHNLSRLFLFMASLITGIAAVVAISSLNYSFQNELNRNAKELLGADLVINSNKKIDSAWYELFTKEKVALAQDAEMPSMVFFVRTNDSRLVKVTGLQGPFPFYGEMVTHPSEAYHKIQNGNFALLDEPLAQQFGVGIGDSLKLGEKLFRIAGTVSKIPGRGGLSATLAPAVYVSLSSLDSTGLIQYGSRVEYSIYVKTKSETETKRLIELVKPIAKKLGDRYETVERRKEGMGRSFKSIYQFFSLLAFVSLILGCIGVASSVHIYVREKREEVAMLRCVGSSGWQAFTIYFIQVFVLGVVGSILGALAGTSVYRLLPVLFKDYLPFQVELLISWRAISEGVLLGLIVSVLFTFLPLVSIRFVPPLTVLRTDFLPGKIFSKTRLIIICLIVVFPFGIATYQTKNLITGTLFAFGIGCALGGLILVAMGLLWFIRKSFPSRASFVFRHALSNLFRPNNQTRMLMVAIGLGAFIISVLNIIQYSLLGQVEFEGNQNQSNTILFDIQPSQRDGVVKLMTDTKLPLKQLVPIVTCRIHELKGRTVEEILKDTAKVREWALTREYRVTYREGLTVSETLVKGEEHHFKKARDSVFVTISEGMDENLKVKVGDSFVFDVQGILVKAFIGGIRKVEWPKDPPNFIFVFPKEALASAPQIWVATTRIDNPQTATRFQQRLVQNFPNVSLIDLRLILQTVNELLGKISWVIRFLALFSIVTGLIVLAGAVINSKFVRMKENVLLRTLGARTNQIVKITLIEYGYLGIFSSLTAMILSLGGGWLLTNFYFEVKFAANFYELVLICLSVILLTVFIGWFNSRRVINTSPLQALRKES